MNYGACKFSKVQEVRLMTVSLRQYSHILYEYYGRIWPMLFE